MVRLRHLFSSTTEMLGASPAARLLSFRLGIVFLIVLGFGITAVPSWAVVASIRFQDYPSRLRADGRSTYVIKVSVIDTNGRPAEGVTVSFTTSLGSITPAAEARGGIVNAVLTSGSSPGTAIISATAGGMRAPDVEVEFTAEGGESQGAASVTTIEGNPVIYVRESGMVVANEDAVFRYGDITVKAAAMQWQITGSSLNAQGNVVISNGKETLAGDAVAFWYRQGRGSLLRYEGDAPVIYSFRAPRLESQVDPKGDIEQFRPARERPSRLNIVTRQMSIRPDGQAVFDNAEILLDDVQVLSLPHYAVNAMSTDQNLLDQNVRMNSGYGLTADLPFYYIARPNRIGSLRMTYNAAPGGLAPQSGWGINIEEQYLLGNKGQGTLNLDSIVSRNSGIRWTHSQEFSSTLRSFTNVRYTRYAANSPRVFEANSTLSKSMPGLYLDLSLRATSYARMTQHMSMASARTIARPLGAGFSWSTGLRLNYTRGTQYLPVIEAGQDASDLTTQLTTSNSLSEILSFNINAPRYKSGKTSLDTGLALSNTWNSGKAHRSLSAISTLRFPIGDLGNVSLTYNGLIVKGNTVNNFSPNRHALSLSLNARKEDAWETFSFASYDMTRSTLFASGSLRYYLPFQRTEEGGSPWSLSIAGTTSSWAGTRYVDTKYAISREIGKWDVSLNYAPNGSEYGSGLSVPGSFGLLGFNGLSGYGYTQKLGKTLWLEFSPMGF